MSEQPKKNLLRTITNGIPILLIKFYRYCISPLFPPVCRFEPSCSAYGLQAFQKHPLHRALFLTVWRIMRCNPFNPGGFDPVPEPKGKASCCDHEDHGVSSTRS
jgi:putative membrane protein insertion efficiency factor